MRWAAESEASKQKPSSDEQRRMFESALDQSYGEAFLTRPEIGRFVEQALLHFDGIRYRLHAWCVMPNHVHVLATPLGEYALSAIVHSWKSYTATQINRLLGRKVSLWFPEYFDRKIRNERHFETAKYYIEHNALSAGLCLATSEWPFSSARLGR